MANGRERASERQPTAPRNVLLVKAGDAAAPVRLGAGDYDRWFFEALGQEGHRFTTVAAHLGAALPARARAFDAVLVAGSPLSVTQPQPWMVRLAEWLREAADQQVPILGVCFGHQLLAWAWGARVVRNVQGREVGTVEVQLSSEGRGDPLFAGLPERFCVQATHEDIVERAPAGARVLAGNANTALQALAFAPRVRGVQFHPELTSGALAALVGARAERLEEEARALGLPPNERVPRILAGLGPTPAGPRILRNFLQHFA
ncbi:glutamine amidotransferase [Aggregicoccus sp. 17bor-14]|uniref:glutamine amidotransferase n=1 Tax=Myxococcaceae TaxID=31 RepID=UPI00351A20A8